MLHYVPGFRRNNGAVNLVAGLLPYNCFISLEKKGAKNADSFEHIAECGWAKYEWLKGFLELPHETFVKHRLWCSSQSKIDIPARAS